MKFKQISFTLAATLALGLAGCNKSEPAVTTTDDAAKAAETARIEAAKVADVAKAEAAKNAETARAEAAKTADAAKAEATRTAEEAKAQAAKTAEGGIVQGLIDKAKNLIAENKFSDASGVLQQLTGMTLSADQTKLVDSLKEQIQKALVAQAAGNAAGGVGGLLKK